MKKKSFSLLIFDDISVEKELGKEMNVSVNSYDKVSALKNKLRIFDIDDKVTDDVINVDDKFIKNKDYIKKDKIKIACVLNLLK